MGKEPCREVGGRVCEEDEGKSPTRRTKKWQKERLTDKEKR